MMPNPRTIFAIPLYNHAKKFREAIESILVQTDSDFVIVLVDDCSTDETENLARGYAQIDSRIVYRRNSTRLGYIENAKHAFEVSTALFPYARYFAWGSDHDIWHPRWLEEMTTALESDQNVALAWPWVVRIDADGRTVNKRVPYFDSTHINDPLSRLRATTLGMSAGNMVYGLFRVDALRACGVMRQVLLPDRLLIAEISLYGSVKQIPDYLWFRRYVGLASLERQRRASFLGRRPFYVFLPVLWTHIWFMSWGQLRGRNRRLPGRTALKAIWSYGTTEVSRHSGRLFRKWILKGGRAAMRRTTKFGRPYLKRAFALVRRIDGVLRRVLGIGRTKGIAAASSD